MTATSESPAAPPASVAAAVLVPSNEMPEGSQKVEELDFDKFSNRNISVVDLVESISNGGFQGSAIGEATKIINQMVCCYNFTPRIIS
jgi:deoxyhypusine synthase